MRFASRPDRERPAVADVDRHDRRLVQHDAVAAHIDECVGGTEIDRHVAADHAERDGCRPCAGPLS